MSRTGRRSSAPAIRLAEDAQEIVDRLASTTGWPGSQTLGFLIAVGWNAVGGKGEKIAAFQRFMTAAVEHQKAMTGYKKKLSASSAELRDAKKAQGTRKEAR
jgi:hypothetical protein